jgi:hypothetical protein
MTQEQKKQENSEQNRIDEVGKSGIYPVSAMEGASDDAVVHGEASLGQGERGAEGYEDSGSSGVFYTDAELKEIKQTEEKPDEDNK